jgi:2-polyprenyl-3-methyl-5-hydroxy-6-metoxy-1,4-benzoquinol methylase
VIPTRDSRRIYYDHEPAYRKIEAKGGCGWDDLGAGDHEGSYTAFQSFVGSAFIPRPGPEVRALDLGCGGGQVAMSLAERGYTVHGVDFSETAIQLAELNAQAAGLAIQFSVGDCLNLDGFGSEVMDLVVDNHVLHCLIGAQDRRTFLQAAYRVLKPGGILFSETMSCEGGFDAVAMDADPATRIARSHTRYWVSQGELNGEMKAAGFRVLHQERREEDEPAGAQIITVAERPVPRELS